MKYLIVSCSLGEKSHSRVMAQHFVKKFEDKNMECDLLDLRDLNLPLCDGNKAYEHEDTLLIRQKVEAADGVVFASPVYNYDMNSAAKNFIELTGKVFNNKVVAFLVAAGGAMSYMAPLGLMNSLMLDFRCIVVPRIVYAPASKFDGYVLKDEKLLERLEGLFQDFTKLTAAIRPVYS